MKIGDRVRNIEDPSKGLGTITDLSNEGKIVTVKWDKHKKRAPHSDWLPSSLEVIPPFDENKFNQIFKESENLHNNLRKASDDYLNEAETSASTILAIIHDNDIESIFDAIYYYITGEKR